VFAGYFVTFNATEYEFDVNVYSPIETVTFQAILITENPGDLSLISVNFDGAVTEYSAYTINDAPNDPKTSIVTFLQPSIETNTLLTIALDERLDPNNDQVNRYEFQLTYFVATNSTQMTGEINVILHEIGKLMLLSIISK